MLRCLTIAFFITLAPGVGSATVQAAPAATRSAHPTPQARDPHTPGFATAKELADGANAPPNADGNFVIGPTHPLAPEMSVKEGVPHGAVFEFVMNSTRVGFIPASRGTPVRLVRSIPPIPAS